MSVCFRLLKLQQSLLESAREFLIFASFWQFLHFFGTLPISLDSMFASDCVFKKNWTSHIADMDGAFFLPDMLELVFVAHV